MTTVPAHGRRRTLALYCAWSAVNQFEWLRVAPVAEHAARQYGVGLGAVGLLATVFPLLFVPLALPSGWLADRLSVRASLRLLAALMAVGAVLRAAWPGYAGMLAGQALIALAQPLAMALATRLAGAWFPPGERLLATSLGTMSLFAGLAAAFLLVPLSAGAVAASLRIDAMALAPLALATFALPPDPRPAGPAAAPPWSALRKLAGKPPIGPLLVLMFLGNGYFNALFSWLQPLLAAQGIGARQAGAAGLLMIGGGVAGMAVAAKLRQDLRSLRRLVLVAALAGAPLTLALASAPSFALAGLAAVALGALILAPLPLLLETVAASVGEALAGLALGLLWLCANAGGAALTALVSWFAGRDQRPAAIGLLAAALLLQAAIAALWLRPYRHAARLGATAATDAAETG